MLTKSSKKLHIPHLADLVRPRNKTCFIHFPYLYSFPLYLYLFMSLGLAGTNLYFTVGFAWFFLST